MHVKLMDYRVPFDEKVMAIIRVVEGELQVQGDISPWIRAHLEGELEHFNQKMSGGAEEFLKRLPFVISGSYTRAKFFAEG